MTAAPRPLGDRRGTVLCTIGGDQYAMRAGDVFEIIRSERLRRPPGPDGAGIIDAGGEHIWVYSLGSALGRSPRTAAVPRPGLHVVVTRGPAGPAGWLVDRAARSAVADDAVVLPLPPIVGPTARRWFEGLLRLDDRSVLLLSPGRLDPRFRPDAAAAADDVQTPAEEAVRDPAWQDLARPLVVLFSSRVLPGSDSQQYAVSARQIAAVIHSLPLVVVPGSAKHVRGVMVWRNAAVPVIDAAGAPADAAGPSRQRYLVARCGTAMNALVALPIEGDVALHEPTRADRCLHEGDNPSFVVGRFSVAGGAVGLLDLDDLLDALASARRPVAAQEAVNETAPDAAGYGAGGQVV